MQIETLLDLLECKLTSIPAEPLPDPPVVNRSNAQVNNQPAPSEQKVEEKKMEEKKVEEKKEVDPEEAKNKARAELYADEQIKKFSQMLKFGVPEPAILVKIRAMGYSDDILEVIFLLILLRKSLLLKEDQIFKVNDLMTRYS